MNQKLVLYLLVLVVIAAVFSGCTAATYGKAQQAFSRGSQMRNQQAAGVDFAATGVDLSNLYDLPQTVSAGSAEQQFSRAKEQLTKALNKKAKLRKDGLLANAHLLLGLTEFQMGNYAAASDQAAAARTIFNEDDANASTDGSRDLALAYALDGMITITQLYDSIKILTQLPAVIAPDSNRTSFLIAEFHERRFSGNEKGGFEAALKDVDFAIAKAANSRETVRYLRNYQLAALLNNRAIIDRFLVVGQRSGTFRRYGASLQDQFYFAENRLNELVEVYRQALLAASPAGENDPYYQFWKGKVF